MIKKDIKGSILYFTIVILGILFSTGAVMSTILVQRVRMIGDMGYSVSAFYAADAGIEKALYVWEHIEEDDVLNWDVYYENSLEDNQRYVLRRYEDGGRLIVVSSGEYLLRSRPDEISSDEVPGIRRGIQVSIPIN